MTKLQRVGREFRNMLVAGLTVVTLATVLGFFSGVHSLLDWFADFRMVYALCALLPLVAWLRHDRRVVGVAATVVIVNGAMLLPWAPTRANECTPDATAISVNAFGTFGDKDVLVANLKKHDADIVFISEVVGEMQPTVAELYPTNVFFKEAPSIALFTKYPVLESELKRSPGGRPYIRALLDTPHGPLRVIGAHTAAPFSEQSSIDRNANLKEIAALAKETTEPLVVLGDMNVTMFSPHYQPLEEAGLRNIRHHMGVNGTWPSISPVRIPIDHVLHNNQLQACSVEVGENFSSDHLPLVAGFRWLSDDTALAGAQVAAR